MGDAETGAARGGGCRKLDGRTKCQLNISLAGGFG